MDIKDIFPVLYVAAVGSLLLYMISYPIRRRFRLKRLEKEVQPGQIWRWEAPPDGSPFAPVERPISFYEVLDVRKGWVRYKMVRFNPNTAQFDPSATDPMDRELDSFVRWHKYVQG